MYVAKNNEDGCKNRSRNKIGFIGDIDINIAINQHDRVREREIEVNERAHLLLHYGGDLRR